MEASESQAQGIEQEASPSGIHSNPGQSVAWKLNTHKQLQQRGHDRPHRNMSCYNWPHGAGLNPSCIWQRMQKLSEEGTFC